jgi:hypothetical protein
MASGRGAEPSWRHQRTVHELRLRKGHGGGGGDGKTSEAHGGSVLSGVARRLSAGRPTSARAASTSEQDSKGSELPEERAFSFKASVVGLPLYAVVRLKGRGAGEEEVGQGVLCLREVLREQQRLDALGTPAAEEGLPQQDKKKEKEKGRPRPSVLAHVDICHGGKLVGSLQVRVRVSVRRIPGAGPAEVGGECGSMK